MKKAYKGIPGNGRAVIRQLEKEGGINNRNLGGAKQAFYYYIKPSGEIRVSDTLPASYELAELPTQTAPSSLCYKGDQYNEGLTISRLEKLGGMNNHGLLGNDPGLYYFIEKNGDIVSDTVIPDGYGLCEEDMYTEKEIRDTLKRFGVPEFANKLIKYLNSNK